MVDSTNLPEVDINAIATDLNNKMDRDGVNASCPTLLSRTANSYGGVVEVWSDGYCVQTGKLLLNSAALETSTTLTFPQEFKDTNYSFIATNSKNDGYDGWGWIFTGTFTTSSVKVIARTYTGTNVINCNWRAEGYIR